uniref:Uncharacterized protein n=1 Tax=Romanomermis culicivorax TaxID=13658 RepID=A0A915HH54_ROMCU
MPRDPSTNTGHCPQILNEKCTHSYCKRMLGNFFKMKQNDFIANRANFAFPTNLSLVYYEDKVTPRNNALGYKEDNRINFEVADDGNNRRKVSMSYQAFCTVIVEMAPFATDVLRQNTKNNMRAVPFHLADV